MLDILVTYPKLSGIGGIETVLTGLLNNYEKENVTFRLFLPGGTTDKRWLNRIPGRYKSIVLHNKKSVISQLLDTFIYIMWHRPKIVIVMSKSQILACYFAKIFNFKMKIISWNHFSINITRSSKILWLFKLCDAHLSISSGISKQLIKLGIDENRVFTIYNPIKNPESLIPRTDGDISKLYYIGRIQYEKQKNMKELLEILSRIESAWHLTIIGTGNLEEIDQLKSLSVTLKIEEYITWLGWTENPWKVIKNADAVVLSSNFEGLPMVLCESIAHGIPAFSSNCETGPEDIVIDGCNGELYELHDINSGKKHLERILKSRLKYTDTKKISKTVSKFSEKEYFLRFKRIMSSFLL